MAAAPEISGLLRGRGRETATCKTLNINDFRVELSNNKLLELVDVQPPIAGKSTISHRSAIPHGSLSVPLFPSTLFDYLSQWLTNPEQAWPLILVLLLILLILLINTLLSTATTEGKRSSERKKLYSRLPAQYQPRWDARKSNEVFWIVQIQKRLGYVGKLKKHPGK